MGQLFSGTSHEGADGCAGKPTLKNLVDLIDHQAVLRPLEVAVASRSEVLTFERLMREVRTSSAALLSMGATSGRSVVIYLEDACTWLISFLAVMRIGGVAVLLDPALDDQEVKVRLQLCTPTLLVCEDDRRVARFASGAPTLYADAVRSTMLARAEPVVASCVSNGLSSQAFVMYEADEQSGELRCQCYSNEGLSILPVIAKSGVPPATRVEIKIPLTYTYDTVMTVIVALAAGGIVRFEGSS